MKEFIEKLIGRLNKEIEETYYLARGGNMVSSMKNRAYHDVKSIVKEFAEEYNNGWIPCSERLPEKYGEYLCCDRYGEYIIGYPIARVSSDDYYVEAEYEIMNDCIAWMPLPEPYEEGSE